MEAKDPKATETSTAGTDQNPSSREPDSAATSKETLRDINDLKATNAENRSLSSEGQAKDSTPSPDGAFDGSRGGDGGVGPM